ncbi:MAG: DHA1 family tetracycline resistance protein-like MFS transporter [Chitinophagales bacterium]|jgi:DHA1 family tetracycline resistance protein-like MFS transporter
MISAKEKANATRFVLITVCAYSMGFGIIMPVLPDLIVELEGVSLSEATLIGGFIASAYAVFQFLMGPLVGNLGDRFGRRPVFLLSLAGFSIDFLLMGFAPSIFWLFIGRSIAGGLGAIFGPANAVMADVSDAKDRAKGFGLVGAAFGIGFMIGPAIGGMLGEYGTRTPFFVASAMAAMTFIYGWFRFPETITEEARRPFSWKRANPIGALIALRQLPGVLGIAMIYFIWVTSTNVFPIIWSYFSAIKYSWNSGTIGLSLSIVGISMALVQVFVLSRVVDRFGERITAIVGLFAAIAGMIFFAFVDNPNYALIGCLFVGFQGMVMPSINAMMSRRTPAQAQGELQGFNGSIAALAALAAPLIYNTSLSYFTAAGNSVYFPGAPFILSSILATIALLCLFLLKPSADSLQQK